LIVSQSLCDVCALPAHAVERILADTRPDIPIVSLDGRSIEGMLASIDDIGTRTGRAAEARALVEGLRERLARVAAAVSDRPPVSVLCLEWLDPPYVCGHWIPEMVHRAGGIDVLGTPGVASARVSWKTVEDASPTLVIAMPCGYDLSRAIQDVECMMARDEWRSAIGDVSVYAVAGGAYFTQPSPRLVTGIEVLAALLHPEAQDWPMPADIAARMPRGTRRLEYQNSIKRQRPR
jgi:iron complex transport system substrate-binding protein